MKRFKIAIVILSVIIVLIVVWIFVLSHIKTDIVSNINFLIESVDSGDSTELEDQTKDINERWRSYAKFLTIFIIHDRIDEITISISKLPALSESDDLSHYKAECQLIIELIEHLWRSELPIIGNVF